MLKDENLSLHQERVVLVRTDAEILCTLCRSLSYIDTWKTLLIQLEDSGTYTCVANNAAGEDTRIVTLAVHTLPTFTELPGDLSLNKGEQLRLSCKAVGIPLPKLTWTFNNNIIPGW